MTASKQKNHFKKIRLLAIIGSACFILTGCTTFGVSNNQWKQLTPAQKQVVMNNYYAQQRQDSEEQARINETNAENAPLTDAIDALSATIPLHTSSSSQSNTHATSHCNPMHTSCSSDSTSSGTSTSVTTPF